MATRHWKKGKKGAKRNEENGEKKKKKRKRARRSLDAKDYKREGEGVNNHPFSFKTPAETEDGDRRAFEGEHFTFARVLS